MPRNVSHPFRIFVCNCVFLLFAAHLIAATPSQLRLLSVADPVQPAPEGGNGDSGFPLLSADGRFVLFATAANNLSAGSNGMKLPSSFPAKLSAYLRDRASNSATLVSVNLSGGDGNDDSVPLAISTNGRFALFESRASDLVLGDTNKLADL